MERPASQRNTSFQYVVRCRQGNLSKKHRAPPVLFYDFVSGHTECLIHEIVHAAGVDIKTAAEVGEGERVMDVPVGLGKECGNGIEFLFHEGKANKKRKKNQGFSGLPRQNMSIFSFS